MVRAALWRRSRTARRWDVPMMAATAGQGVEAGVCWTVVSSFALYATLFTTSATGCTSFLRDPTLTPNNTLSSSHVLSLPRRLLRCSLPSQRSVPCTASCRLFPLTLSLLTLAVSAQTCSRQYTVKAGDICDSISAQQNVSTYVFATFSLLLPRSCSVPRTATSLQP